MNRNLLAPRDLRKAEQAYTNAGRPTLKWRRRKHWLKVCNRYFNFTPALGKNPPGLVDISPEEVKALNELSDLCARSRMKS